ncbi:uncharacterized protein LOC130807518 isoform X2 [Amaranthus tricolor]|uniref:uncharacterized protein LOC130807518 isoform X2 n=1 Tax=Amaranthus tricolor TaxID=29722 RepID=UPI00258CDA7E|nr:uncharacterized protein LOC130807518 isoform X2 [Amaranthus tricolor]
MHYNYHHHHHFHSQPCLHCHPHSYIRMVQHLIERCLLLQMDRDQCIKALAEHAKIRPLITLTDRHVQQPPRFIRKRRYHWR